MIKINWIKKVKITRLLIWQIFVVAMMLFFVVMLFLNIYTFDNLTKELKSFVPIGYRSVEIDVELFDQVMTKFEEKENTFNEVILIKPSVLDPSL